MALYIEEGPDLPPHVKLNHTKRDGWRLWWDDGDDMWLELTFLREVAEAAGWIVVREEENDA